MMKRNIKLCLHLLSWYIDGGWNPSSLKKRTRFSYIVTTIRFGDLTTKGSRPSAWYGSNRRPTTGVKEAGEIWVSLVSTAYNALLNCAKFYQSRIYSIALLTINSTSTLFINLALNLCFGSHGMIPLSTKPQSLWIPLQHIVTFCSEGDALRPNRTNRSLVKHNEAYWSVKMHHILWKLSLIDI